MSWKNFRKWREENPELYQKRLELSRNWHEENRERARHAAKEEMARRRAEDPEKYRAYMRNYQRSRPPEAKERLIVQHAEYYRTHKAQFQENGRRWVAENIEQERMRNRIKQAQRRKTGSDKFSSSDVETLFEAQDGKCAACRKAFPAIGKNRFEVDHIIPLKPLNGGIPGSNEIENLQLLCKSCNSSKGNRDHAQWLKTKILDSR